MPNVIQTYDKNNQPTGRTSTINAALKRGDWCRGAHVVVCTRSGKVLIQKRSVNMIMHPGLLDISAGGFVDAGETPEATAVRELYEEYGLTVKPEDLRFVGLYRHNHYWPKLHKKNRSFIYLYVAIIPDEADVSHVQHSEVAWAKFISLRQAKQLVRRQSIKSLGRLEARAKLYKDSIAAVERLLQA